MALFVVELAGSAIILLVASQIVFKQVSNIANALRVPSFVVSLLLVAFSTSIPELFVGVTSAIQGTPSFSLGDIFGSNIVNLTFISGLVILLGRKEITLPENISSKLLLSTFAIASAPVFLILDGTLSRFDGLLLLTIYFLYLFFIISGHRKTFDSQRKDADLSRSLTLFFVGAAFLIASSEAIIRVASGISHDFHITPFIVGVFAIAFSTSLPELTFGLRSAFQRTPELSLGDVVGSSAVNASGILGLVAFMHPITPLALDGVLLTGFFGIFVFLVFFLLVGRGKVKASRGAILLILYLIFASFNLAAR